MSDGRSALFGVGNVAVGAARGWVLVVFFVGVVAVTGGASRYDAVQIVTLRPLAALLLIPALYCLTAERLMSERTLICLFAAFSFVVAVHLLPLPPAVWQALPGRSGVAELGAALDVDSVWRPITLAPMRTWNALGSLIVPAAALILALAFTSSCEALLRIIAGLGIISAVLGLLQTVSGGAGIFYFYEVTNVGRTVGILANENHAGILAASSMLVVAYLGVRARSRREAVWLRIGYPAAFFLIFFTSLVGASRAGFAACFAAVLVGVAMVAVAPASRARRKPARGFQGWFVRHPRMILVFPVALAIFAVASFLSLDRAPAFSDIVGKDSFADLRWSLWPVLAEMLSVDFIFGAGLGSFEQVYHIFEPSELLMSVYVNQAHNDWAQIVIEGGGVAGLLLILLIVWVAIKIMPFYKLKRSVPFVFWFSVLALIALASVIDYPLRTPLFQSVLVFLLIALSRDSRDETATSAKRSGG